jgi:poly(beta-D-mannuronate) lyase
MARFCRSVLGFAVVLASMPAAAACPALPAPVRDLDIPRFYGDAAGTKVDPQAKARHGAATAPLVAFVRGLAVSADRAARSSIGARGSAEASCALAALESWARAGALLGRASQQGEYQRKWDLAGIALAYVKLRPHASPAQRRAIEPWLQELARATRRFFDDPRRKRNNHWYWLGLARAGVAVATDDAAWWAEARAIYRDGVADIAADGFLAMELARGPRALHYHVFATMPLVMLAEIAAARGEDWYGERGGALHRLVSVTVRGVAQPDLFALRSGARQELTPGSVGAGWLLLYEGRFPGRIEPVSVPQRTSHRLLGGDVRTLMPALRQRQAQR